MKRNGKLVVFACVIVLAAALAVGLILRARVRREKTVMGEGTVTYDVLVRTERKLTKRQIKQINAEETYPSSMASLVQIFHSVEELYEDAELAVEVIVQGTEVILLDDLPQTLSTVRVVTALKGQPSGDTVIVREEGGVVDGRQQHWGVPPMEEGQHLILFLVDSGLGNENEYCVLGAYQGKFIEREGYFFQQATEDVKLSDEAYSPQKIDEWTAMPARNG